MDRLFVGGAIVLGLFATGSSATGLVTPPEADANFAVIWILSSSEDFSHQKSVGVGDSALHARLLPSALYINDADVVDDQNRLVLPAGSEMAAAEVDKNWKMACVINSYKLSKKYKQRFTAALRNTCLIDTDGDGKFDKYSLYRSAYFSIGAIGKVRHLEGVMPSPYHLLDSKNSVDSPSVDISLLEVSEKNLSFQFCIIDFYSSGACLNHKYEILSKDIPTGVVVEGGRIDILSRSDKRVVVRVSRDIPAQPIKIYNWLSS